MIKDKALEELFLTQKPHFDDHEAFMANLTKRLDAVEFIRQHQAVSIRRPLSVVIRWQWLLPSLSVLSVEPLQ